MPKHQCPVNDQAPMTKQGSCAGTKWHFVAHRALTYPRVAVPATAGKLWAFGWCGYSVAKEHGRFAANAKCRMENAEWQRRSQESRGNARSLYIYGVVWRLPKMEVQYS
jgi:hypothetical protein